MEFAEGAMDQNCSLILNFFTEENDQLCTRYDRYNSEDFYNLDQGDCITQNIQYIQSLSEGKISQNIDSYNELMLNLQLYRVLSFIIISVLVIAYLLVRRKNLNSMESNERAAFKNLPLVFQNRLLENRRIFLHIDFHRRLFVICGSISIQIFSMANNGSFFLFRCNIQHLHYFQMCIPSIQDEFYNPSSCKGQEYWLWIN